MTFFIAVLVGLVLIIGPFIVGSQMGMSTFSTAVCVVIGAAVLGLTALMAMITKLYRKTSANQAFVKTGGRKAKVILDKGDFVIPVLHKLVEVSLETMRLDVKRFAADALITKDNLRVDINSEFYIRVQPSPEDILAAARSLGEKSVRADAVKALVGEKLISALRAVAATKELMELQLKRDEFASAVQENLVADLRQNGLTLETVTISMLDQTPSENLNPRNIFDAQGLRKITEITQAQNVQRNRIDRDAELAIKEKDVSTRKDVLNQEKDQAEAEASQATEVANIQAVKLRERQEYEINQRREVELAAVAKDEAVNKAEITKNEVIQVADVEREREVQTQAVVRDRTVQEAEVKKNQAVEVAKRLKEIEVAKKETERATAEAQTRAAEATREEETQRIETVKVTASADRNAAEKMITEKQEVDILKYQELTNADIKAYELEKVAGGELEAAKMQKEAKLVLAIAEAEAAKKRAEGAEAEQMVPVSVDRERVDVESARVEVERQALQNKQEFSEAALKFEVQKLEIQAGADVQKAFAEAIGQMLTDANMQIFGDPTTLSNMTTRFMSAAGWGQSFNGLRATLPDDAREAAAKLLTGTGVALSSLVERATGKRLDPDLIEETVRRVVDEKLSAPANDSRSAASSQSASKSGAGQIAKDKQAAPPDASKKGPEHRPRPDSDHRGK
ncbi:MAG: hypothetical protein KAY37_09020 [Phycisphaerae bacterium]|nr:hypothetical protein [Phycisphaerae bacterium]